MTDKDIRYTVTADDRFSGTFALLKRDLSDIASGGGGIMGVATRLATVAAPALAASVAVGQLWNAIRGGADALDKLNDASDALGDSIENISGLEDLAKRNGAGLDLVVTAVTKLNKTLSEAKADSPLAKALQAIGLNAAELRKEAPANALLEVATALNRYENDGNRARLTQELFGKSTREVAAFLKDLAEQGRINAVVTAQQAAAAEQFNKHLNSIAVNGEAAKRALVGGLLPMLNEDLARIRALGDVFGSVAQGALTVTLQGKRFTDAGEGVQYYAQQLVNVRAAIKNLETRGTGIFDKLNADGLRAQLGDLEKLEAYYRRVFALTAADNGQSDPRELARRGRAKLLLPDMTDLGGGGADTKKLTEAERYLDSLRRQADKLDDLSALEQALREIEAGRLDGITPKLEELIKKEAQRIDGTKAQNKALREQQEGLDALIASSLKRSDEVDRLLANTTSGKLAKIDREVEIIIKFARSNPENAAVQRQALEAVRGLNAEAKKLENQVDELDKSFDKLTVTIDRFAERSTDAIVDFVTEGKMELGGLFKMFEKDLLRELIADPVRDTMRDVVKTIRDAIKSVEAGGNPLAQLFAFLGVGGGSNAPNLGGDIGQFFGGATSRALGGPVRGGQLVRWQENGAEYFVSDSDGRVVTQSQMNGAGGAAMTQENHFHINGNDVTAMRRELRAALDERDARLMRRLQYGRGVLAGG